MVKKGIRKLKVGYARIKETDPLKLTAIGLCSAIVLLCIVFSFPLKTVPYQTLETYYETEMQQESYIVSEPYVTEESHEKSEVIFDGFEYVVPSGVNIYFRVNRPNTRVVGSFENPIPGGFYIYSPSGRVIYEKLGDRGTFEIPLLEGKYRAQFREDVMWSEQVYIKLSLKWAELEQVTRYKEVIKYREVPVQVEKKRTVTEYKKVSMWKYIFDD